MLRLFLFLFILCSVSPSSPLPYAEVSLLIDSGGSANFTSQFNRTWLADRYFSGGAPGVVASPHDFLQQQERTLRFFSPISSGKKNCYSVPVAPGRYYVRVFTVYDNYDSKLKAPSFDVSFGTTLVFSWRTPWPESATRAGSYSDLFAFVADGSNADICFYSIATDAPVVGSIELISVDPLSYDSTSTGHDLVLVNYGRLSCGSELFGPGFTLDFDRFGRVWSSDAQYRSSTSGAKVKALSTTKQILGTDLSPNHFPGRLYQTAIVADTASSPIEYTLPVDTRLDYMVWLHFAEIDPAVSKPGQRVFDVIIDRKNVTRIDIFKEVNSFAAFKWQYVVRNLTNTPLSVKLMPVVGPPLISGIENYAMVPLDLATVPSQVAAMRTLKESLRIPDRMGWNGDPCAPSSWDAWEGVTCHRSDSGLGLVITQLDLASQGLKGFIGDEIRYLTNLVSLNLSYNSLGGTLPAGLGQRSLVKLDLSGNQITGNIPDSLASSSLQLVLLNNNELEGQVPERVYTIGVRGGEIDLSGNKGLCGVPSLPACPYFWEKGKLSTGGKVAIGLSCIVILCVIVLPIYIFCARRRRNDYDFAFSQDLTSIAAKRNRYHRQKSLMLLEMETQSSSNGFHSTLNPL